MEDLREEHSLSDFIKLFKSFLDSKMELSHFVLKALPYFADIFFQKKKCLKCVLVEQCVG